MKKKTLVPLIVFLLGICLVSFIVYKTDTHEKEQRVSNMAECFMYCLWTGKICIFIMVINFLNHESKNGCNIFLQSGLTFSFILHRIYSTTENLFCYQE